jgi:hypothetical protein
MRMIKFAVALCFAAALVTLSNYPQLVTVHGAAPRVLPQNEAYHTAFVNSGPRSCSNSIGCHGVSTKFHTLEPVINFKQLPTHPLTPPLRGRSWPGVRPKVNVNNSLKIQRKS